MNTDKITRENIGMQFCSDWLKEQMLAMISERENLEAEVAVLKSALEEIDAKKEMTQLAKCCVDRTCHLHEHGGCSFQIGVNRGYRDSASIASEALIQIRAPLP